MKAQIDNWALVRSALVVAERGTLSAAAQTLGLHHATVSRHIDTLEAALGCKLFYRHSHGYIATEAGRELARVGASVRDQLMQLAHRLQGKDEDISGPLTLTTVAELTPLLTPWLAELHMQHPKLTIQLVAKKDKLKLEYGEADIAIRAGEKPQEPDNVVQHFSDITLGLYAHQSYVARHGMPRNEQELQNHWFVIAGNAKNGSPLHTWLFKKAPKDRIIFTSEEPLLVNQALYQGMGIGIHFTDTVPATETLLPVLQNEACLHSNLWLTTHIDVHWTTKVQAVLAFLKNKVQESNDTKNSPP